METFLIILIIIAIAYIVFVSIKVPSFKTRGEIGEDEVAREIQHAIRKGSYGKILQNVYIPKSNGGTTEIDVLFISVKGIFVFEVKNYAGYIFGSSDRKDWTVTLYAGKNWYGKNEVEKHQFYNPIWQNRGHISNLKRLLNYGTPFFSAVVFSDRCELKDVKYDPGECEILHTSDISSYLNTMFKYMADSLTEEEVDRIYELLLPYTNVTKEDKAKHVNQVINQQHNMPRCPYCGNSLVIRTAKSGPRAGKQFYGCSNYPKCHYIQNIDDLRHASAPGP